MGKESPGTELPDGNGRGITREFRQLRHLLGEDGGCQEAALFPPLSQVSESKN